MRKVTIDETSAGLLDDVLDQARKERVLLKRCGRPVALVINVEDKDEEQIELENDPQFWRMIEKSRREATVPFEKVMTKLVADEKAERASRRKKIQGAKLRKKA
jgi:hypothetical protein